MNINLIEIKLHVEVGSSGMPTQIPYVHVNDVKLFALAQMDFQPAMRILQQLAENSAALGHPMQFQSEPSLTF